MGRPKRMRKVVSLGGALLVGVSSSIAALLLRDVFWAWSIGLLAGGFVATIGALS